MCNDQNLVTKLIKNEGTLIGKNLIIVENRKYFYYFYRSPAE